MSKAMENVTAKTEETKAEKFVRLGEYRINKAMDAIGRIENSLPTVPPTTTRRSRWKPCFRFWNQRLRK